LTPGDGIAGVIRTDVAIITVQRWSTDTDSGRTGVSRGTGIAVVTGISIIAVLTPGNWITAIGCTNIAIITV
jgi:uncharacterized membrane protein YgaE (UPF0421/DUF939 family)